MDKELQRLRIAQTKTSAAKKKTVARTKAESTPDEDASNHPQNRLLKLQQTRGNKYVQALIKQERAANTGSVQRYQAGDEGHGGIEQRALTSIGFKKDDASAIYFGNFLRDFSQLSTKIDPVISILSMGEFNEIAHRNQAEAAGPSMGMYVASEHLDNPQGGDSIESIDPLTDPAGYNAAYDKLSPSQRSMQKTLDSKKGLIARNAAEKDLPDYIERGKTAVKMQLKQAAAQGKNPNNMALTGSALHAVEDYFSHSNFVDLALWMLDQEGIAAAKPFVAAMIRNMENQNPALAGDMTADGHPGIVTGTYRPGANDWVSRLEILKTELSHGQFSHAFVIGLVRMGKLPMDVLTRVLLGGTGALLGGTVGAVGGGLKGAAVGTYEGAAQGAAQGEASGQASGYAAGSSAFGGGVVGDYVGQETAAIGGMMGKAWGGLTGGAKGLFTGAYQGGKEGLIGGGKMGYGAGETVGKGINWVSDKLAVGSTELVLGAAQLALLLEAPEVKVEIAAAIALIDQVIDELSKIETRKSAEQARSAKLKGPTHSQLAKDSPDHPLFKVSVGLAEFTDREIGKIMKQAWDKGYNSGVDSQIDTAVDRYVSHPSRDGWWRPVLTTLINKK